MRSLRLASALLFALTCGCATAPARVPFPHPPPAVDERSANELVSALIAKLDGSPQDAQVALSRLTAVLWQQTAAEHEAVCLETYATATRMLDAALADPSWTAVDGDDPATLAAKPPALIIDLDETILDNSSEAAREILWQRPFNLPDWELWLRQGSAKVFPGAAAFLHHAADRGVEIFYVTNTEVSMVPLMERKLRAEQLPYPDGHVIPHDESRGWSNDKTSRRQEIARTHRVLLLMGDDLGDFVSVTGKGREERDQLVARNQERWGRQWIVVANPGYGSWLRTLERGAAPSEGSAALLRILDPALPIPPAARAPAAGHE